MLRIIPHMNEPPAINAVGTNVSDPRIRQNNWLTDINGAVNGTTRRFCRTGAAYAG
jgi:hypothetical protein